MGVNGEGEIPERVVAVLTPDMPDALSHVSIRARNNKVCFATCFDQNIVKNLKLKEAKAISITMKSMNLILSNVSGSDVSLNSSVPSSIPRAVTFKRKSFCGKYAVSAEEFATEMVGAKSCNIKTLRERVPSWIKIPIPVALPFGAFDTVLSEDVNKDMAKRLSSFCKSALGGDLTKLQAMQDAVQQISAPLSLIYELKSKMRSSRISRPGDESEERWARALQAIKKVWASKWNKRAYVSCRKANPNRGNLCMAVLIQEIICGDYVFVSHTKNTLSGDASEIYAEIVKGLGETLVGAYPGRAVSFLAKKGNLKFPTVRLNPPYVPSLDASFFLDKEGQVTGYPSKNAGLYSKPSIIFRSDSKGEDLEGYAGDGLYDRVLMDEEEKLVLYYSSDRFIVDKAFQTSLFSKIVEAGKGIENLCRCSQHIEGVVKDGAIYVVQAKPQI